MQLKKIILIYIAMCQKLFLTWTKRSSPLVYFGDFNNIHPVGQQRALLNIAHVILPLTMILMKFNELVFLFIIFIYINTSWSLFSSLFWASQQSMTFMNFVCRFLRFKTWCISQKRTPLMEMFEWHISFQKSPLKIIIRRFWPSLY